ncbi:MAG: family 20 glycosylhydrolase [Rheinheimera sp.]
MNTANTRITALLVLLQSPLLMAQNFTEQPQLQQFASQAKLEFAIESNFHAAGPLGRIKLHNSSKIDLAPGAGNWQIYVHSIRKLREAEPSGLRIEHVQGDLHRITATQAFKGLAAGQQLELSFHASSSLVSYSDFMPRAFIVAGSLQPELFVNTDTETLSQFVAPFNNREQQLRYQQPKPDLYPIATASSRYQQNLRVNEAGVTAESVRDRIVPTPKSAIYGRGRTEVNQSWQIVFQGRLTTEAAYLQTQLAMAGLKLSSRSGVNEKHQQRIVLMVDPTLQGAERYQLNINADSILIRGSDNAGAFYGLQSLLSLMPAQLNQATVSLPRVSVDDAPRYRWRGMHYDMARNFHGKEVTLRLIEQMARYKLNKLHLHLTEDEGWRLEIPGLPELTEIGANRCFDLTEQRCLLTQLGTGPHSSGSGNGYYSTADFIEILKFAAERHIEVVPEIDMPGHARAAIKAMEARYQKLQAQGKTEEASRYLLSDPADKSVYMTVQNYTDNSVNVCMESSYAFIDKVVYELQQMYRQAGIKLNTYHMGGDEVGVGSWEGSPACQALFAKNLPAVAGVADLKPYFVSRVATMLHSRQLALAGWEDGLMYDKVNTFNRDQFANNQVIANVWDNIWEWGVGDRAYRLANAGYQVILSHGTHLYFDHPQEAHPEERGYYWATRFSDSARVFGYMPDHLYANADKTREGEVITDLETLVGRAMPALEKPENVIGMQGQLWSETVRTAMQLEQMIYPRLLPLAERAWHQASWETAPADTKRRDADWQSFARVMAERELPKLSKAGVSYYLPPPGAVIVNGELKANTAFPGLAIEYSLDQGDSWLAYPVGSKEGVKVTSNALAGGKVWLRSKSIQGDVSRVTTTDE